jgi:CelD/BcsL family acetyltransferase involved in cellulose biosynthesis
MATAEPMNGTCISGPVSMQCVSDLEDFRALRQDWQDLFSVCAAQTPFTSWEWLFSWWMAYGGTRPLRILTVRRNGKLSGIAPLYVDNERTPFRTTCRILKMIGDGSFDSDHLDFLIEPGHEAGVTSAFGTWLSKSAEWDAIALRELTGASSLANSMRDFAACTGADLLTERTPSAVLDLPASFDTFLKERQARFRTRVRALLRKVDQGELAFESRCEPSELRRKLRSLFALHQRRWEATGGTGVFNAPAKRRFYAHFAARFARNDWLRLYSLRRGKQYVAHQLCFGIKGVTYLLQEGFDTADPSASYGQMLRAAVIRHLIETGESQYDFLGGFSRHKEEWGARRATMLRIIVARPTLRAWIYVNAPMWRESIANTAKRVLPAAAITGLRRLRTRVQ